MALRCNEQTNSLFTNQFTARSLDTLKGELLSSELLNQEDFYLYQFIILFNMMMLYA